jgi:peptidoglycan-associated lipoprotein
MNAPKRATSIMISVQAANVKFPINVEGLIDITLSFLKIFKTLKGERLMKVTLKLLAAALLVVLVACSSKPKTDNLAGEPDGSVTNEAMSFDVTGSDSGSIEGLKSITFEYDRASLTSEARGILSSNATWIKNFKGTVQVEGHCDERGTIEYNLALGERRAVSVKNYLVSLGVASNKLTIISYGEEKPLVRGESEDAWARNRRANFVPLQ